jgi:hypothetical protein
MEHIKRNHENKSRKELPVKWNKVRRAVVISPVIRPFMEKLLKGR